jgi:hypothetical protein
MSKTKPTPEQVQALYDQLTAAEQRAMFTRLAFQHSKPESAGEAPIEVRLLHEALSEVVFRCPPLPILTKSYGKARFDGDAKAVAQFVSKASSGHILRRPHRQALTKTCLQCLDTYCKWWRQSPAGPGPAGLLAQLGYLQEAVDAAFPGYAGAGMLHRILPGKP